MPNADAVLLLQALAVVAMGAAGSCLLRIAATAGARVFGVGLVVAAALAAVDSMPFAGHGLPLAGFALFAFACLATGPRASQLAASIAATPLRLVVFGVASALLLHWAHRVVPTQPGVELGLVWYGLDLACALGLGWLAATQRELAFALRSVLGAAAAGLACTSFASEHGVALAAAMQTAGCAGILWRGLVEARRCLTIALASTFAIALTCALRANAERHGAPWSFAGLDDPLLVLAALFAAFGVALHREHAAVAEHSAAPWAPTAEPNTTPTQALDLAAASPPTPEPTPEPVPEQTPDLAVSPPSATEPVPEQASASTPADLIDLPDENDAMRARAEAEHTLSQLFSFDDAREPERGDAPVPAPADAD